MIFLLVTACGYEAIYSKKNESIYNFSINEMNFVGNRIINLKIKEKLNNYTLKQKEKKFTLKITSNVNKIILGKNISGDPTSFRIVAKVRIEISTKDKIKNNLSLVESFNYNNNNNKLNLKKYEREIKNSLAQIIANKLIFKLTQIQ